MIVEFAWLIPLFPLASFLVLVAFGNVLKEYAAYIGIVATLFSCGLSLSMLLGTSVNDYTQTLWTWMTFGDIPIQLGISLNALNVMMLLVVSFISFLVHVYSMGYMQGDRRFSVYYQYLGLFTFAMLGLVMSPNFLQVYMFWELVGVCSFLLIGFYFDNPDARAAAKKAFIVTRIGDVGFLIALLVMFAYVQSFEFGAVFQAVESGALPDVVITWIAVLLFIGAIGKSGQFPLHVWLPDAMEGPTPVSALIHAATMVAAGVYLVALSYPLFVASDVAMWLVAIIGAFTALFAATVALAQNDIKRILAYSTISQLGYMMLGLGVGSYVAGIFHLFTHAFFKALLFLAAGSVIHVFQTNNIYEMGGVYRQMRLTGTVFLVGTLALAGIPPFSGFFSKELILSAAYEKSPILYGVGVVTAFLTAFYMMRLFIIAFTGERRNSRKGHEAPASMTVPMVVLAVFAVVAGMVETPWNSAFTKWQQARAAVSTMDLTVPHAPLWTQLVAVVLALFGLWLAYLVYVRDLKDPVTSWTRRLSTIAYRQFYVNEVYHAVVVRPLTGLGIILRWLDRSIVEGLVALAVQIAVTTARLHAKLQNGQVQAYSGVVFVGLTLLLLAYTWVTKGVHR